MTPCLLCTSKRASKSSWRRVLANSFGDLFRITTWGESHGPAIGVCIDGCPAGVPLDVSEIHEELKRRAPGMRAFTSPRKEADEPQLLSGVYEGKTTGAPISILIWNRDVDGAPYKAVDKVLRPGHAEYTYLAKYGHTLSGVGRASARETACRVAAGAVAKKLLALSQIEVCAYLAQVGTIEAAATTDDLKARRDLSEIFCPDAEAEVEMRAFLEQLLKEGDSIGGIVALTTSSLPVGLGDPIYAKLEAKLGSAMLSLPATKGFEIGCGMGVAALRGSQHNDSFVTRDGEIALETNRAGGTLAGISTGEPLFIRVAFKPPSSIRMPQRSVTTEGQATEFTMGGRHDPCVAIRAVPVVEAMAALVLADCLLMQKALKFFS